MQKTAVKYARVDYGLMIAVFALVILGVVMVYSTSFYNMLVVNRSPETILLSSIRYAVIGIAVMVIMSLINYRIWRHVAWLFYTVAIVLSIIVLFYGTNLGGGTRWIIIPGLGISFMPSELAKIAIVIGFAWLVAMAGKRIKELKHFVIMTVLLAIVCVLTVLQRDLSTAAIILMLGMLMLFVGRCNWLFIAGLGALGSFLALFYINVNDYTKLRVSIWLQSIFDRSYVFSDDRYQIIYSIYAIGNGGLFGKGLGMGEMKLLRLPEAYNDFIFAIICEEFGFFGALVVLALFAFIIYRIFSIAVQARDSFGFMIAAGTGILIALQVIVNIGVVTNVLPTTGITLPFVSKGGTSLVILMFLVGIVLNISLQNKLGESL